VSPPRQDGSFTGMPVPATGLLVASFPLINFYNPYGLGEYFQSPWKIYLVIALLCWLMISRIRFFKLMPRRWQLAESWPQLTLIVATLALAPFLKTAVIPAAFVLYVLLSMVYRPSQNEAESAA